MTELLVYPHCDMHVALQKPAAKTLPFKVFRQTLNVDDTTYTLTDVTDSCTYRRLAPYRPVGSRLHDFVTIDPIAGTITGDEVGTNLIVIERNGRFIVARIQVHDDVLGWWFGNSSITTALDPTVAHSQPSVFALFSNDATGTDLVGDITGHGFVTLTSASPATFVVDNANNQGRLRGVSEGSAQLNGSFLGINASLEVNVVDYPKARNNLVTVRAADIANASEKHNILFLAEGFRAAEKDKFDRIVQEVTDGLFSQERHEPFKTLQGSFNVFKSFQASKDSLVTCGFRVNDEEAPSFATGRAIPDINEVSSDENIYTPLELIRRVGLPLRNETATAAQLKARWASQSLANYNANKVDNTLIEAWRKSKSLGILEARDTFFGLMLGFRWADAETGTGPALAMPAADNAADPNLAPFIERAYTFFTPANATRHLAPDRRRHPPELHEEGLENRGNAIMRYLGGLKLAAPPNTGLGTQWVPDGTFKRSRGLIAMITNDSMHGGTNFGESTVTANTVAKHTALEFEYPATNTATRKVMRRKVPAEIPQDVEGIVNTVAHEFGHSFHLGDEYETRVGDKADANSGYDNIVSLDDVHSDPNYANNASRLVDPDKVKWFDLLRIELSTTLTLDSSEQGNEIEVTIDPRQIPGWAKAKASGRQVHIRRIVIADDGAQLPLSPTDENYLVRLDIGAIDETAGKMRLGGMEMPPSPFPTFPKGSLLFTPMRDSEGHLIFVVEKKVRDFIASNHTPLNKNTDTAHVNDEGDDPKDIPDFKPPCKAQRLLGIYEGAVNYTGLVYRPAGACKMRDSSGAYCHVCKWLITNRVDAAWHDVIDRKFYPKAKKNG